MSRDNSAEHKGLSLLPFLGVGTGSLARLSPDGEALTAWHFAQVRATPPGPRRAGIADSEK